MNSRGTSNPQTTTMFKLNLASLFTLSTAVALLGYSIYMIGRLMAGANMSGSEINLLALLTVVNAINMIHQPSEK